MKTQLRSDDGRTSEAQDLRLAQSLFSSVGLPVEDATTDKRHQAKALLCRLLRIELELSTVSDSDGVTYYPESGDFHVAKNALVLAFGDVRVIALVSFNIRVKEGEAVDAFLRRAVETLGQATKNMMESLNDKGIAAYKCAL